MGSTVLSTQRQRLLVTAWHICCEVQSLSSIDTIEVACEVMMSEKIGKRCLDFPWAYLPYATYLHGVSYCWHFFCKVLWGSLVSTLDRAVLPTCPQHQPSSAFILAQICSKWLILVLQGTRFSYNLVLALTSVCQCSWVNAGIQGVSASIWPLIGILCHVG